VIKTGETEFVLMADLHHIITDGVSNEILVNDFVTFYSGAELPPLKMHYKDFSEWQNHLAITGGIKKQEAYWFDRFKDGVLDLDMITDYPRPSVRNIAEGDFITFDFDEKLCEKLKEVVMETETTSFMVLLAGYNILLAKYTKKEDIVVGTLLSGRSHADLQGVIGMFVNTLPIRNYLRKNDTFKEFLGKVKENALKAYENQDYPLDELVAALGFQGDSSRNPLFDTVFTLDIMDNREDISNPERTVQPYGYNQKFAKFDLYFQVNESNETISILLRYSTQLFKPSTIKKIAKYYTEIMEQVVNDISIKLKDVTLSHEFLTVKSAIQKDDGMDFNL
jgi:hypothetical protein